MFRLSVVFILAALLAFLIWQRSEPAAPGPAAPAAASPGTMTEAQPKALAATAGLVGPSPVAAPSPAASPAAGASPAACGYGPSTRLAALQDRAIGEASALVASRRTPGAYWTLNDSGNDPLLFAFDEQGRSLGTFRVEGASNVDWEDLQTGPGRDGGPALYVGDTGDNLGSRRQSVVYRVPEPELSRAAEKPLSGKTAPAEAFRFVFPDGAHDTEAMLVHPMSGEVQLITKDYGGRAGVYRFPRPLDAQRAAILEPIADLDLRYLGPFTSAVTDAAIAPDARRVVLRTYLFALEYDLADGASLASVWQQQPGVYRLDDGPQGEGVTYPLNRRALLTIGEGLPAILYQNEWRC